MFVNRLKFETLSLKNLVDSVSQEKEWLNKTLARLAQDILEVDRNRVTHYFDGIPYTISQIWIDAQKVAEALRCAGLKRGDSVSIQLPNWYEFLPIHLGCSILGLIVVPIVSIYRNYEVEHILDTCDVKASFFPSIYRGHNYAEMMGGISSEMDNPPLLICVRGDHPDAVNYERFVLNSGSERSNFGADVDPSDPRLVLFTSGTTGEPKAVLHSYNTGPIRIKRGMEHWNKNYGLDEEILLMASPVTHVTGLSALELPFYRSCKTFFMERWDANEAVEIIDKYRVTNSLGATPFLKELLDAAEKYGSKLPSLRTFACGGAEVPPSLIYRAKELLENCKAFRVYGSSEVPLVSPGFVGHDEIDLAANTDGQVLDYSVRIRGPLGEDLPIGQEGEVFVKGAAMFLGYHDVSQTRDTLSPDFYFRTGDLGILGSNGSIVITGRIKDLINRGGEKISAKEVEDAIYKLPFINEVAVVSMPHLRLGETLCAYVVVTEDHDLTIEQLQLHFESLGLAKQKVPERLEVVELLPKTPSGKIKKNILRDWVR